MNEPANETKKKWLRRYSLDFHCADFILTIILLLQEAVALLEPMMNDPVNYVRQGALLASALVLVQHTEFTSSKVKDIRQLYAKVISPS